MKEKACPLSLIAYPTKATLLSAKMGSDPPYPFIHLLLPYPPEEAEGVFKVLDDNL